MRKGFVRLVSVLTLILLLSGCSMPFVAENAVSYFIESEAVLRYPYCQLTENEKAVYKVLYDGIMNMDEKINLPYQISGDEYEKVFTLLYRQEPEFFYLDTKYCISEKMSSASISYLYSKEEKDDMQIRIDEKVQPVLDSINIEQSEYDKFLYIHDYITGNCSYAQNSEINSSTIYGCLVENSAQCEGYSKTLLYLARLSGLNAMTVVGHTDEGINHEWNIVEVDGEFYNTDLTWDDPLLNEEEEENTWYLYYNVTDSEIIGVTHFPEDNNYIMPECDSVAANYYYLNNIVADSYEEAYNIIDNEVWDAVSSESPFVNIKLTDESTYSEVKKVLFDDGEIFNILDNVNKKAIHHIDANQYIQHEKEGVWCISIMLIFT